MHDFRGLGINCNVMGDYANMLASQGIHVVAVMEPGKTPHPRATYPYTIDEGKKLAKKYEVHGSRPVIVAVFPEKGRYYTVARGVTSPDEVIENAFEFAETDHLVKPFSFSPKKDAVKKFMATLGGVKGVGGGVSPASISIKQGLGVAQGIKEGQ